MDGRPCAAVDVPEGPARLAEAAERARFGGIGLTRREALRELRDGFAYTDEMLATLNEPFGRDGYSRLMIALSGLGEHDDDGPASRGLEVRALIAAGADVTATSSKGRTALHFAASNGRPDAVRMLLAAGARPNAPAADGPLGVTPLSWAAHCVADERARQRPKPPGSAEAARRPARAAAALWDRDHLQRRATRETQRCLEAVRELLRAGADPNAGWARSMRGTPLRVAIAREQHEIADLLRAHGGVVEVGPDSAGTLI